LNIVKDTIAELKALGIRGTLTSYIIAATCTLGGPWTMAYVRYDDGVIGCGVANNELAVPDDVSFIKPLLNRDAYDVMEALFAGEKSVFVNSLILSLVSALSHRTWEDPVIYGSNGYRIEEVVIPRQPIPELVRAGDVVVLVGFAAWDVPALTGIAREVNVLELEDLKDFKLIDFCPRDSKVKLFPAERSEEVLSRADVVSITGQTIVNETIDDILHFSRNARTRVIYGATSSFYPKVLFERGIDASVSIVFSNTDEFRQQFADSRGYFYQIPGVKRFLVVREEPVSKRGCRDTSLPGFGCPRI